MRFYYSSFISEIFLGVIYLIGTLLLIGFGLWLRKRRAKAWRVILPLFLLLYISPIAEELWIAWNFGRLCKKDAGLFVQKTVEVEGFYDDTHGWRADKLRESGYQWVEGRGETSLWRHERLGNEIRSYKIDHPTARYHYIGDRYGVEVAHKINRETSSVLDTQSSETLGRYVVYSREAPWFFIHLDRPNLGCDGPEGGPDAKHINSFLIYRDILKPTSPGGAEKK